jgi:Uma2 family endonuclease
MSSVHKYLPHYTLEDYKKWEDDWELIEGIPYALASPSFKYQRIVGKNFRYLDEYLEENCPDCLVGLDTDYIVSEDTVLRPDVFITCEPVEDRLLKSPAVVFEVVSPSTREKTKNLKRKFRKGKMFPI